MGKRQDAWLAQGACILLSKVNLRIDSGSYRLVQYLCFFVLFYLHEKNLRLYSEKFGTYFMGSISIWESSFKSKILCFCSCPDTIFIMLLMVKGTKKTPQKNKVKQNLSNGDTKTIPLYTDKFVKEKYLF